MVRWHEPPTKACKSPTRAAHPMEVAVANDALTVSDTPTAVAPTRGRGSSLMYTLGMPIAMLGREGRHRERLGLAHPRRPLTGPSWL